MKHITFLDTDKKAYAKARKEAQKKKYTSLLIQLYIGFTDKKKIKQKLQQIAQDFPSAVVIGATSAGEISHAKMYEKSLVFSCSFFTKTALKVAYTKKTNDVGGKALAKKIDAKRAKAAIILSEGLKESTHEDFLSAIVSINPKMIIAGGLAGDNFKLKRTFVCLGTKVYGQGSVAVSFLSDKLLASNAYNFNWTPIGKEFVITKGKGNVVEEIDGMDAVAFFEKYLGKKLLRENKLALPNFQLLFKEGDTLVGRTPLQMTKKGIVLAGPIHEGQVVQFGFSNESSLLDGAYQLGHKFSKKRAEAIYIFSCIARKALLGKVLQKEFLAFEALAPTSGFFTYGEFYSGVDRASLLNCTTTILVLSEGHKRKKVQKIKKKEKTLDTITFDALTHFIKQTSLELKHNVALTNQYKNAVDASALVSKTDKDGFITYVNEHFCKVSKYSADELIGKKHNIVRDPQVSSFIFKKMWQTLLAGKVWRGSFSNKAKDGSLYYVDATIMPIFDENGEIEEFIAIRQDITKQVQAKNRMKQKERLIRAIFDNQDSIVIHASKSRGMLEVNKKLFDYFDFKNFEDFKSKHSCLCELFLEEEGYVNVKHNPNWLDEIASNEDKDYKVKMRAKTGKIHTFTIRTKRIQDEYIINLYDITKLEDALLRAYSSEKSKSIFLANMSHEIRTPLNGILGFTDLLMKKELERDAKRYVEIIHKSGETLLGVVNDILDFSKLESGELKLYETEVNLFEEMEAAVATFASLSKQKKINYYVYIDTKLPKTVRCDIQRLKQVMNNLISNAIKFTPENGEVIVRVELLNMEDGSAKIHFSVQDSGIGIAKEKLSSIFDAFSQADNSISREFGGTGLGLAISNQYINMMGSHIQLKSEVGKGSEFFFDLDFEVIDADSSFRKSDTVRDKTIAVVDSYKGVSCGVNTIIYNYLDAWSYNYKELESLDEVDEKIDILIVCAKIFDAGECEKLLHKYPTLELVYIEGAENSFECDAKNFHKIAQPMTGSALFDTLISLVDPQLFEAKPVIVRDTEEKRYDARVLVAEDNETNQMLISIMLKERGIDHTIVENGQEVLDTIKQNSHYDLIFMDINMPILDGIETTKRLREQGYDMPIVSLSANVIESDTQAFKDAGMNDILNKPVIPRELDSILNKYLRAVNHKVYDFDKVDIEAIAKKLSFADSSVVIHLLKSLAKTFTKALQDLKEEDPDYKEIFHRLKGASGNMRFEKLYKVLQKIEEKDHIDEEDIEELEAHLRYALKEIEKLA